MFMCFCMVAHGQSNGEDQLNLTERHEGCARDLCVTQSNEPLPPSLPLADENAPPPSRRALCQYSSHQAFATLSKEEMFDYIIGLGDPRDCILRVIYSFNNEWSPIIYSDENVRYIAQQGRDLATSFNGKTDNGINAVFAYLSIAGLNATFYSTQIDYADETWQAIQETAHLLAANPRIDGDTETSYLTMAHLFFAASFNTIGQDPAILELSKYMLERLGESSFLNSNLSSLYPYYYCYYYLLDLYHRYPVDNPDFVQAIGELEGSITALGLGAINTNLNTDNHQFFDEISNLTVSGLGRYAPHEILREELEPSLQAVTDTYGTTDARWISAALSLVQNDMEFELSEEEIVNELRSQVLPHTYYFHDKKMIIYTQLDYQEVINLYQASAEVEAQFFRMLGHRIPADMGNDTLHAVVYGTRSDYQNYNNLLYGINFPGSGGIYIESQSTLYTYDRTELESSYSLEELFRHEYAHYLQGKYIIPGGWGQSPNYDNSRLVWFEEGMAQFLSGSTRHDGIKSLEVVRDRINRDQTYNTLTDVFQSSYGNGNSGSFYIYGAMLWDKLYHDNPNRVIELIQYLRGGHLGLFDDLIESIESSAFEQQCFEDYIDAALTDEDFWISPVTMGPLPYTVNSVLLDVLENAIAQSINGSNQSAEITVLEQPRRFEITGVMEVAQPPMSLGQLHISARALLDQKLKDIDQLTYNNIDFTTAHFENLRIDVATNMYIADYVISGPLNDECTPIDSDDVVVTTFLDRSHVSVPPAFLGIATLRYRLQGTELWNYLDNLSTDFFIIEGLDAQGPVEYEITYSCGGDLMAPYSRREILEYCPRDITYNERVVNNIDLRAAYIADISSVVEQGGALSVATGSGTHLQQDFTIYQGSTFEVSIESCIN